MQNGDGEIFRPKRESRVCYRRDSFDISKDPVQAMLWRSFVLSKKLAER